MAYSPTVWVEGSTKLGPTNMNKIETALTQMPYLPDFSANKVPVSNGSAWLAQLIANAQIDPAAAIAYSKLALSGSIVNADVSGSAAIAYSKLSLAGSIVNADIASAAAIAGSKLGTDVARVYDRVTTTVDVNTSTTETSIYTKSIAGNDMGTNRRLRLTMDGDYLHNNVAGDNIRLRIKFGGTTFYDTGAAWSFQGVTGAGRHPWTWVLNITNLGATNSQMLSGLIVTEQADRGAPTSGIGINSQGGVDQFVPHGISTLGTIDTTSAQTLDITVQWSASSANNSWRLRSAILELV